MDSPEIKRKKCRQSIDPIYKSLSELQKFDEIELSKLEKAEKVIILEICPSITKCELNSWMQLYENLQRMDWSPKLNIDKCLSSNSIMFSSLFSKIHEFKCEKYKLDPLKTFLSNKLIEN